MKYIIKITLTILFLLSCKNKQDFFFTKPVSNERDIKIKDLIIETIQLQKIETSFTGILKIHGDLLYFADARFCWVYVFDKNCNLLSKNLGQGGGPKELNTGMIDLFEPLRDDNFIFIGSGNDCHLYNNKFERIRKFVIDKGTSMSNKKQMINITADMKWVYTLCYPKLIARNYNNYLFYNVYVDHPNYNMCTSADYYKNGRIIAKMNLKNGKIEEILGRISPEYQKHHFIGQFGLPSFDISSEGDFYVCFEADPVIYVYDKNYSLKEAFGTKGRNMNTSYKEISLINEFKREVQSQREECGYYDFIEYIDERGLLFRSYTKGNKETTDGLQIYKGDCLIADVDVPKNFKILGYIEPYFYSDVIIDEENGVLKVYRFKLDKL
ncbi:MAG: hypothetical protein NT144_13635 [Bacteroidia bacterium]|nr:hypothetical protein [Bacteroidia bacterium]